MVAPELEDEECPERLAMVVAAGLMLGDAPGDLLRVEEALAFQALAAQKLVHQGGQGTTQPTGYRNSEALLGTIEDRRRQPARRRTLEQALGLVAAEFEGRGKCLNEIDQTRVQERRPDLEPAGHAGPINLRQDVLGQVRILIESQRPGKRVGAPVEALRTANVLDLDACWVAVNQEPGDLRAENEPSQRW